MGVKKAEQGKAYKEWMSMWKGGETGILNRVVRVGSLKK